MSSTRPRQRMCETYVESTCGFLRDVAGGMLAVMVGRAALLRVRNNAIIIRVPSHVIILRNGRHRQRQRMRTSRKY